VRLRHITYKATETAVRLRHITYKPTVRLLSDSGILLTRPPVRLL